MVEAEIVPLKLALPLSSMQKLGLINSPLSKSMYKPVAGFAA
jgi:hypothetical protein